MPAFAVTDWDDAYANMPNIPGGEAYPGGWTSLAKAFRDGAGKTGKLAADRRYGGHERCTFDRFEPADAPRGTVIFIHGGYWMRFDKSFFSHLAAGALARGWTVAMPQYPLCPEVHVRDIARHVGDAVATIAAETHGPIALAGHSAGGHLAARMICADSPLPAPVRDRIRIVVPISGVHDLRPLLKTQNNETIRLDEAEALAESPALMRPAVDCPIVCWVGANERSEFVRQNALLANIWRGLGASTQCVEEPDRHHMNIIEGLTDADHPLTRMLTPD